MEKNTLVKSFTGPGGNVQIHDKTLLLLKLVVVLYCIYIVSCNHVLSFVFYIFSSFETNQEEVQDIFSDCPEQCFSPGQREWHVCLESCNNIWWT